MPEHKHTVALIDADGPIYRIAARHTTSYEWDDGEVETSMDAAGAVADLETWVADLEATLLADEVVMTLSCKPYYRDDVWPEYKASRGQPPALLPVLRDFVNSNWRTFIKPTLEADDVLGILSTHPTIIKGHKIVVSPDKDLKTIPGFLYDPGKPSLGVVEIDEYEADLWFFTQALTGDSTDNYPGCPGIGPVKAAKALDGCETEYDMWQAVVETFKSTGLTADDALTQARVARICRASDYDFKKKEVILWNPPKRYESF